MSNTNVQPITPVKSPDNDDKTIARAALIIGVIFGGLCLFALGMLVGSGRLALLNPLNRALTTSTTSKLDYMQLNEIYSTLKNNYNGTVTDAEVLDGLKHGLAKSVNDPYTEYMSAKEAQDFNGSLQGEFSGIGAKLELDTDKNVVIAAPLSGSPAEAAGLRAKDIILSIDGTSTFGISASDAVTKIRGQKGTQVKLGILRNKTDKLDFTITRDTIKIPSVVSKELDGGIGYLQVSQFSDNTDELVQTAAEGFKKDGITKIILDLRDNPGGEVTTAVNLSSEWLNPGDVIVQEKHGSTVTDTQYATSQNTLKGMKTVVLVNAGSASASEITALALRDHKAATIIGEQSYGKGVVQRLFTLNDGGSLKVTVAKWYSPNGSNIDHAGIKPDQVVTPTEDDYKNSNDVQLQAAQAFLSK